MLLSTYRVFYFWYSSIILTGLQASIGVTRSSSSRPFLCALASVYCPCATMYSISWYQLKTRHVCVYTAVLSYVAVVFCPIQTILEAYKYISPSKKLSSCTPRWLLFLLIWWFNSTRNDSLYQTVFTLTWGTRHQPGAKHCGSSCMTDLLLTSSRTHKNGRLE